MMQRQEKTFLSRFRGEALAGQQLVWPSWLHAPVSSLEFRLSEAQRVKPDAKGRLSNVMVEMSYTILTI